MKSKSEKLSRAYTLSSKKHDRVLIEDLNLQREANPTVSVVVPVFKAQDYIEIFCIGLRNSLIELGVSFEIILIEDGSPDLTWNSIKNSCLKYPEIRALRLSRNFGQHPALVAGIHESHSDYTILMDCDGEDGFAAIPVLLEKIRSGFDIVYCNRKRRTHSLSRRLQSRAFAILFRSVTTTDWSAEIGTMRIFNRKVRDAFCQYSESRPAVGGLFYNLGFHHTTIDIPHRSRIGGVSTYTFLSRLRLATDALISFSILPLRLSIWLGAITAVTSVIAAFTVLLLLILDRDFRAGWPSLVISIWFLNGLILLLLGILGEYVGRIFEETKRRPLYFISERLEASPDEL